MELAQSKGSPVNIPAPIGRAATAQKNSRTERKRQNEMSTAMTLLLAKTHLNLGNLSSRNKPLPSLPASVRFGRKNNT